MAHATVQMGSTGAEVRTLQGELNQGQSQYPALTVDGIFGAKTRARVGEFQGQSALAADGIAGPLTWAKVDAIAPPPPGPSAGDETSSCGNGDPDCAAVAARITRELLDWFSGLATARPRTRAVSAAPAFALTGAASRNGAGSGPTPRGRIRDWVPVWGGSSLLPLRESGLLSGRVVSIFRSTTDFDRVYVCRLAPLPKTYTISVDPVGIPNVSMRRIQVMVMGNSPTDDEVVHEMTHVWQHQHISHPLMIFENCRICRGNALSMNLDAAKASPSLLLQPGFPSNSPFSPRAYLPGSRMEDCSAEQVAQQVQNGERGILRQIAGARMPFPNSWAGSFPYFACQRSAMNYFVTDRRDPRVKL